MAQLSEVVNLIQKAGVPYVLQDKVVGSVSGAYLQAAANLTAYLGDIVKLSHGGYYSGSRGNLLIDNVTTLVGYHVRGGSIYVDDYVANYGSPVGVWLVRKESVVSNVPAPAVTALLGLGLTGIAVVRRRRT